jgi:acyl-CoA dehydrogenase
MYRSPVDDILYSLRHVAGLDEAIAQGLFGDLDWDTAAAVIGEAGRFATDVIAPLNRPGDVEGARCENGVVTTPKGYADAYRQWVAGGWAGVTAKPEQGGMALPHSVNFACTEIWNGASMGFALCPLLSEGALSALNAYASPDLRETFVKRLASGEWTGTMNLTEPQAGSDLNALKSRAERAADGTFRVFGQKIYITYGEHDFADNIVHLVLARLPDAPPGTRGISLFLVPKFLVKPDGSLGQRNDVRCASIEHKLGIHASPTCVMIYGDVEGAIGYLVGEENRGLAAMFVMMNSARLSVGLQGVAVAERAYQHALAYARDRKQGRAGAAAGMSPIVDHPDVRRMLLTMKANIQAARGICHLTGVAIDLSRHAATKEARAAAAERAALLTPVAKAWSTDIGDETASLGVQIHGGMGYVEETGAAQFLRDSRICAIYEGTNGIQAIDLVTRKIALGGGAAVKREIAFIRDVAAKATAPAFGACGARLAAAADALERATDYLLGADQEAALSGAYPYLRLFGIALGGACLAKAGLAEGAPGRVALARYFAETQSPLAPGLAEAVIAAGGALGGAEEALKEVA